MTLRHALFALVPTLVVALLVGTAAELYLRWERAGVRAAIEAKAAGRERCTQASTDPVRIYEGIPGKCGNNALGFRDRDHALAKPAGTFRVAVIGDSIALGQGVRADEAFARVLEARLRQSGIDAEVTLFAVTGYSTVQEFALLDIASRYRPDLVVWAYALNDPADPVFDNANGELGVYFDRPTSYVVEYLRGLVHRVRFRIRARDCPAEWHARMHCGYRDEIDRQFGAIATAGKAHATPIVVALLPVIPPQGSFREYPLRPIHADLRELARRHGLPVIDSLDAWTGVDAAAVQLTGPGGAHDPWHPNARGHALIGDFLAEQLAPTITEALRRGK
ncbi:MAG: SGNH/GDSL hydrolase family protein [Burkholderiales bacterium]|nr:SGNH/GDSL hydrolase family protein [Burkholderiales bacterium]